MRLSHRLEQINQMITQRYGHIWDCCCDHGFLGAALTQRGAADTVHFVDQVPALTDQLQATLERLSAGPLRGRSWQVHCMDVKTLRLPKTEAPQLIIIAGVGGDLTIEMVQAISAAHPDQTLEFMLCPVRQHYQLRQALIAEGFGLVNEALVKENGRFYEVLHVSSHSARAISEVGCMMWDLSRELDREYLARTIGHYERTAHRAGLHVAAALNQYRALLPAT